MNINEIMDTILGRFFGKVALIPLILFFLYCFTACMLITATFINLYIFKETPTWALLVFMLVPVSYASYKGVGTIGRLANFVVPMIMLMMVIFFLMGIKDMDFSTLSPVLADSTFSDLSLGAFLTAARYSEILIFLVYSYFLAKNASINRTYAFALVTFAICFALILLPTMLVLGIGYAKIAWNPYLFIQGRLSCQASLKGCRLSIR